MANGIYTATAGAIARQHQLDVAAHNLANVGTTGYRTMSVGFEEILTHARSDTRAFTGVGQSRISTEAGNIEQTGNALDLTIVGVGFFLAHAPGGEPVLVRSGAFSVTDDGRLTDDGGRTLFGGGAPILVDPTLPVSVDPDGEVFQEPPSLDAGGPPPAPVRVGRIDVVNVPDGSALAPAGRGVYRPTKASGEPYEVKSDVLSGALESSNVQPVECMIQLIQLQRDFSSLLRTIHAYKEADEQLVRTANGG